MVKVARRHSPEEVDDGVRAAHDAYEAMRVEPIIPRSIRRDAYKDQQLAPVGAKVHELPLRRCPGCQSRNAAPIGFGPRRRLVYGCPVCRRRFFADSEA